MIPASLPKSILRAQYVQLLKNLPFSQFFNACFSRGNKKNQFEDKVGDKSIKIDRIATILIYLLPNARIVNHISFLIYN
ncbi:hypothetical protein SAMN05661012_02922 [Chitinophaga sancti]|uniref:Uncharacterized protein n=1 Tax=Chitinophaga sancti TaxID=1004 RepID=A0A1K1QLX6_9BACT|nr:hypothetical protein SAMN05661012_02922 [Chitinophaga sancti]